MEEMKVTIMKTQSHLLSIPFQFTQAPTLDHHSPSRNTSLIPLPSFFSVWFPLPGRLLTPWKNVVSFRKTCWLEAPLLCLLHLSRCNIIFQSWPFFKSSSVWILWAGIVSYSSLYFEHFVFWTSASGSSKCSINAHWIYACVNTLLSEVKSLICV